MFTCCRRISLLFLAISFAGMGFLFGCARTTIPLTQISVPILKSPVTIDTLLELFDGYEEGNFYSLSWTDAFEGMHAKLSREYPLTEWKEIDWEALYDTYRPQIAAAEVNEDVQAYYLALRAYVFSIPDGYMRISTPEDFREAAIGGDYGFSVLPLTDGRIVVGDLEEDGFAEHSGIHWGAEIIEWNGVPAREALDATSVLWSDSPPATDEYALFERCMMLTRAPVDTEVTVSFRNPGQESIWVTRLRAHRDRFKGLEDLTQQGKVFSEFESPLETRILPGNMGYIKLYCQSPTLAMPFPMRAFRKTIERFIEEEVVGIVVDLRGNSGGEDDLSAAFAGYFAQQPLFFRNVVAFDEEKGGFALLEWERLVVEPRTPVYSGPVAILIHRNTRDSGQAIVNVLAAQPNVFTVGVVGTEGSYAYVGAEITMPGGYEVFYPIGRMLDEENNILVASGADRVSRLVPDLLVPITLEDLDLFFNQGGDPVLDYAVTEIKQRITQP